MVDWRKYDVPPEPKVSLRDEITPMRDPVPVGRLAVPYNRDPDTVFVKKVVRGNPPDAPEHYFNKHSGYPMSQDILDQLDLHGAELVFIYEEDTDRVFEHELADFNLPIESSSSDQNQQFCASEQDALYTWQDLGADLFTNNSFWSQQ